MATVRHARQSTGARCTERQPIAPCGMITGAGSGNGAGSRKKTSGCATRRPARNNACTRHLTNFQTELSHWTWAIPPPFRLRKR
ncbi:MAG TPA: hypothetical protein PLQ35_17205 [bacterium]|nr:hypothetical protein [bacterium]